MQRVSSAYTSPHFQRKPLSMRASRGLLGLSAWSTKSFQTKTAAPASCTWFAAASPANAIPVPRTAKTVASRGVPTTGSPNSRRLLLRKVG